VRLNKPPLGIAPRHLVPAVSDSRRLRLLKNAIRRKYKFGGEIPEKWLAELAGLSTSPRGYYFK